MTAHVLYPALDPVFPATLSEKIIGKLLREELGYQGVVFGDDLGMKAISKNYPLEESVSRAVQAGVDMLLLCHDKTSAIRAFDFLYQKSEKDVKLEERIEESHQRIKRLKEGYLRSFTGVGEQQLKSFIGTPLHRAIADEVQGSL